MIRWEFILIIVYAIPEPSDKHVKENTWIASM